MTCVKLLERVVVEWLTQMPANRLGVGSSPSRDLDFSMAHGSEQCEVKAGVFKSNTSGHECHY